MTVARLIIHDIVDARTGNKEITFSFFKPHIFARTFDRERGAPDSSAEWDFPNPSACDRGDRYLYAALFCDVQGLYS